MSYIPLSLYIHFPWCVRKCPYCDFNSHSLKGNIDEDKYITRLINDLEYDIERFSENRAVSSVFLGGGTPSLFSPKSIKKLINNISKKIKLYSDIEITIECNPGTIDNKNILGYYDSGINRISIGVQSFSNTMLKNLGRVHDENSASLAIRNAIKAGFNDINIDLMFALPNQTLEGSKRDIEKALMLYVTHISYYQLTLEPNTMFWHNPPKVPEDDLAYNMLEQNHALLRSKGYKQYEVSAWTNKNPCRHNINYWQYGDYIGIGAGAHGKVTTYENGVKKIIRTKKIRHPKDYLAKSTSISSFEEIEEKDKAFQFMLNALRLKDGFSKPLLYERSILNNFSEVEEKIKYLIGDGFLKKEGDIIKTSDKGFLFLNNILAEFL